MDEEKEFPPEGEKIKGGREEAESGAVNKPPATSSEPAFTPASSQEPPEATPAKGSPPQITPSSQETTISATSAGTGAPGFAEQTSPIGQPTYQEPAAQPGSPQATFAPPATTPPTAPAPKKKSKKWWILGGCAGCGCLVLIALLAFLFIGGGAALFSGLQAPVKVVDEYLQAATTGDFAKAYTYLSQDLQKEVDLSGFSEFVKTHPENYEGIDKATTSSVNINNNQADIRGKVIYKDGSSAPLEATLVKEGSFWKIRSITVKAKE